MFSQTWGTAAKKKKKGVPSVVQWVKNLTAAARVAVVAQVQSPAWLSGLKDPALWQLWRCMCFRLSR